jgi:preprotein translocase subunit SecA
MQFNLQDNSFEVGNVKKLIAKMLDERDSLYGERLVHDAEKYVLLMTLDQLWKEHLLSLDHLRQGIGLRAYGQKNPLNEYKREAFNMFSAMLDELKILFIQRTCALHFDVSNLDRNIDYSSAEKKLKHMTQTRNDPAFNRHDSDRSNTETSSRSDFVAVSAEYRNPDDPNTWGKISRNEPCPCGSSKKYKHCHGTI